MDRVTNGALSLCYAGGVATEKDYEGESGACWLELAEKCGANKCHLHIYPSIWNSTKYADYIALDAESEYFHFHRSVAYEQLSKELSQYDYGIHPSKRDFQQKETMGSTNKNKVCYSAVNHFFDYLDAGLPIIASVPTKLAGFFEAQKVLLNWSVEDYDFEVMARRKDELKQNAACAWKKLRVSMQVDQLIGFYHSL